MYEGCSCSEYCYTFISPASSVLGLHVCDTIPVFVVIVVLFCFIFFSDSEHGNFETKFLCLAMVILKGVHKLTFWP